MPRGIKIQVRLLGMRRRVLPEINPALDILGIGIFDESPGRFVEVPVFVARTEPAHIERKERRAGRDRIECLVVWIAKSFDHVRRSAFAGNWVLGIRAETP